MIVLGLGTFWGLGRFVAWDVLELGRSGAGTFWGLTFCRSTFFISTFTTSSSKRSNHVCCKMFLWTLYCSALQKLLIFCYSSDCRYVVNHLSSAQDDSEVQSSQIPFRTVYLLRNFDQSQGAIDFRRGGDAISWGVNDVCLANMLTRFHVSLHTCYL